METTMRLIFSALFALPLCSCANVQYTERAFLADYVMLPEKDPLYNSMSEHLYFSREAAYGGEGVGGGGCGCN